MKQLLTTALFFCIALSSAQTKLELTPKGFLPVEMKTPSLPPDQLIDVSKAWAPYYNKNGYDVLGVTDNALTIEAKVENAYYYYNVGVKYNCDIKYSLKIVFQENKTYKLTLTVKELYGENVLLKTTVADFFTPDGKLKDDFRDAKPSLDKTVNNIIKSFANFISR